MVCECSQAEYTNISVEGGPRLYEFCRASTVSLGALQLQERMAVIRVWVACSEAEGTDVAHIPLELVHRFREIIVPTVAVVLAVE